MPNVIWLHVLNGIPHFYYSYPILKPIHYHLVSDFKIRPGLLLTSGTWAEHSSLSSQQKQRRKCLEFVVTFRKVFVVLIAKLPLWSKLPERYQCNNIGTSRRLFCCSSTPNPPTRKMVSKPRTGRKCRMWWFSVIHDFLPFIVVPLRNNVPHEIA
jgi:hypothetical protein